MFCPFLINLHDHFLAIPIHFLHSLKLNSRQEVWVKAWLRPKADVAVVCWRDATEHFPYAWVYTQEIEFFKRVIVKTSFSTSICFIVSKFQASRYDTEKTNIEYGKKNPYLLLPANPTLVTPRYFFLMLKLKLKQSATLTDPLFHPEKSVPQNGTKDFPLCIHCPSTELPIHLKLARDQWYLCTSLLGVNTLWQI